MPVGTKGTVKSVDPDELRALGAAIVLGNTYHLHFRPGDELVAELGGLHAFMGWDGPILTDSGGFQVFSLRDTLLGVDDDGVTFRSVYDGSPARFTPETVARIQASLGSDIAMCLDICAPAGVPRGELADAVRRTTLWARRQRRAPRAPGQLLFGITQGASDPELRRRSIAEITELGFDGHALGGLSVGESSRDDARGGRVGGPRAPGRPAALLHGHRRHRGRARGDRARRRHVRLRAADAHRTHRLGPHLGGTAQPPQRPLRARPAPARRDLLLPGVHALLARLRPPPVNQQELLGLRLLSLHNLSHLLQLTAGARAAIERSTFAAYKAEVLARLSGAREEVS